MFSKGKLKIKNIRCMQYFMRSGDGAWLNDENVLNIKRKVETQYLRCIQLFKVQESGPMTKVFIFPKD
jgi:hypothetical protein